MRCSIPLNIDRRALIVLDFAGTAPREVLLAGVVPETLAGGWRCQRGWRGR
jgi:hypothetical protein